MSATYVPTAHFGSVSGPSAKKVLRHKGDIGACRSWLDPRTGRSFVTLKVRDRDGSLIMNRHTKRPAEQDVEIQNEATLFRDEWKYIDTAIQRIVRQPRTIWSDLRAANTLRIPNAMGKSVIQWQSITDAGTADMSMDGLRRGQRDRPHTDIAYLPLPIIHGDGGFTMREIESSRESGIPLDTFMLEQLTDRCLAKAEGLTAGTEPTFTYGGGTIYGAINHPTRVQFTIVQPTAVGWTPDDTLNDVLAMRQYMLDNYFNGPFTLYVSPGWAKFMDVDYSQAKGTNTLRQRLSSGVDGLASIKVLWSLSNYSMVLTQMNNPGCTRAIVGMDPRVVEWETEGGFDVQIKVLMIYVPHFRANLNGFLPIVHGF